MQLLYHKIAVLSSIYVPFTLLLKVFVVFSICKNRLEKSKCGDRGIESRRLQIASLIAHHKLPVA